MKWIGLTGGIASGKSTVSQMLRKLSYPVIDADEIAREVVAHGSPGLKSVLREFGADLMLPDGSLDRRRLGQLVFGDPVRLQKLESILHPLVRARLRELREELERKQTPLAFYDVPLLFEKGMEGDFDAVVVVFSTPEQQVQRLRARSQLSDGEIRMRIASQIPLEHKTKKAHFVIQNDRDSAHLEQEVQRMLGFIKALKD